jgi:hypothetical protein
MQQAQRLHGETCFTWLKSDKEASVAALEQARGKSWKMSPESVQIMKGLWTVLSTQAVVLGATVWRIECQGKSQNEAN